MSDFWNERYAASDYIYGKEPNEFFREHLEVIPVGRMLVPGAGEGRDAVYAATQGWEVDAFDGSSEGQKKAMQLAQEKNVRIRYAVYDAATFKEQTGQYDAAVLSFFHLPSTLRKELHRKIAGSLKPGGWFILECFNKKQIPLSSGGPKDPDLLPEPADLLADLKGMKMDVLISETAQTVLNEGSYHQGPAEVTRFLARKH